MFARLKALIRSRFKSHQLDPTPTQDPTPTIPITSGGTKPTTRTVYLTLPEWEALPQAERDRYNRIAVKFRNDHPVWSNQVFHQERMNLPMSLYEPADLHFRPGTPRPKLAFTLVFAEEPTHPSEKSPPKVFLVKKKSGEMYEGFLNLPGGKIEEGESPEQCARREFLEETGREALQCTLLGTLADEKDVFIVYVYHAYVGPYVHPPGCALHMTTHDDRALFALGTQDLPVVLALCKARLQGWVLVENAQRRWEVMLRTRDQVKAAAARPDDSYVKQDYGPSAPIPENFDNIALKTDTQPRRIFP